jgi:hypothetical protein
MQYYQKRGFRKTQNKRRKKRKTNKQSNIIPLILLVCFCSSLFWSIEKFNYYSRIGPKKKLTNIHNIVIVPYMIIFFMIIFI